MPDGYLGRNFLVKIETAVPGTFVTVAGMRATSLSLNNEKIDVTTKDDSTWRKRIAGGIQSLEASMSGVFRNDASQKRMMALSVSGEIFNCKLVLADGDEFAGQMSIDKLERAGDHDKEETYSVTLGSCGAVVFTEGA